MTTVSSSKTAYTLPASFTPQQQEELYYEFVRLYDLTDNVLALVQDKNALNRDIQLELVTPFITQVTNSTNILTTFYNEVVRKGLPITPELQDTMESAFKNIFITLKAFIDGAEAKLLPKEI